MLEVASVMADSSTWTGRSLLASALIRLTNSDYRQRHSMTSMSVYLLVMVPCTN